MQGKPSATTLPEVKERLVSLINEIAKIPRDRITDHATVDEELRMESISFVELQVAIEEEYGIQIDPVRVVELNEFGAIADYVHECAAGGGA
jgi:acyl carrier protein